jgi:hypothetical protein
VETSTTLTTAETLTESFCERCGTRYEFSAPTRLNPLRKTRGLIGGLKNYLTSQDALGDALDDAMRTEEGALATAQLDAFHESFNFCIDCRQYTCVSCWNDEAGRCRSCVPVPGTDDLAERLAASLAPPADGVAGADLSDDDIRRRLEPESWPTSDLPVEAATNGHVDDSWATTPGAWTGAPPAPTYDAEEIAASIGGFVGADGFVYETKEQADQVAANMLAEALAAEEAARAAAELEAQAVAEAEAEEQSTVEAAAGDEALAADPRAAWVASELDQEPVAAAAEPDHHLRVVAWDEDASLELAPEPVVAETEPEPVVAETEPEPILAETEPEPVAAETEPEPVVAETEPEPPAPAPIAPISETILRFPQRPVEPEAAQPEAAQPAAAQDETPEVAARRAQLDMLGLGGETQPDMPTVIPYRSRGAAVTPAELALLAAAGQRFWEASAREVASAVGNVGVQNCEACGLSLSANARFCRRCGTRQAQSA